MAIASGPGSEAKARLLAGGCLCGAVRYEVADAFEYAANCHCSDCRRTTGAACKPFAGIGAERLRLVADPADVLHYGEPQGARDVHCRHCGSLLYSVVRENRYVHVALGTLADAPSIRPDHHIFAGSRAPWHEITDDLPQYAGHADGPLLNARG